jgi:hypothetical protein
LIEREAQLRTEYRPRTWADCVRALMVTFDQTTPHDQLLKDLADQLRAATQVR